MLAPRQRGLAASLAILLCVPSATADVRAARADRDAALDALGATFAAAPGDDELAPYLVEAAAAAGLDPAAWPAGHPVLDGLVVPDSGALLAKLRPAHALAVSGHLNASSPVVAAIFAAFDGNQFGAAQLLNDDMWALLTLRAAGVPAADTRLQGAAVALLQAQGSDGGWSWHRNGTSETDETAMALVVLGELGALPAAAAQDAAAFLDTTRHAGSGWSLVPGAPANCDSTVWGLRATAATGRAQPSEAWDFLHSLRRGAGYAFSADGDSNPLCTAEVVTILGNALDAGWDLQGYGPSRSAPGLYPLASGLALAACAGIARASLRRRGHAP